MQGPTDGDSRCGVSRCAVDLAGGGSAFPVAAVDDYGGAGDGDQFGVGVWLLVLGRAVL